LNLCRLNEDRHRYQRLCQCGTETVILALFGAGRQTGGGHLVFKMPWAGDPRINLQKGSGGAKPYQVRQLLQAVDKLAALPSTAAEIEIAEPGEAKRSTDAKRTGRRKAGKKGQGNG
jgi:hypothetical protein